MFEEIRSNLRIEILTLYHALKDKRTPITAKVVCFLTCAYALSPIDIIPDFIPIIGQLDDIIIVPVGLWLSKLLIPSTLWQEIKKEVTKLEPKNKNLPSIWAGIVLAICSWIIIGFIVYKIYNKFF